MFDHFGINVRDFERSKTFYTQALAPLDVTLAKNYPGEAAGFGTEGKPAFWLISRTPITLEAHVAFIAKDRDAVKKFYEAAMRAGGRDNGAPGIREPYHPNYFAAFVLDPDGNNVEAVCHNPE